MNKNFIHYIYTEIQQITLNILIKVHPIYVISKRISAKSMTYADKYLSITFRKLIK